MIKKLNNFLVWILIASTLPAYATNETKKLNQVLSNISKLKTDISKTQTQQLTISQQLKDTEINISELSANYHQTAQHIQKQLATLKTLNANKIANENQLAYTKKLLLQQICSIYTTRQTNSLKTLLNQEDPTKFNRMVVYHRYLVDSRLQLINQINQTLARLQHNKIKIEEHTKVLKKLEARQKAEQLKLEQLKQQHLHLLKQVKSKMQTQNEKLKVLLANKANLEKVIQKLKTTTKPSLQTQTQMCTNFVWPTHGKIIIHFGSAIEQSQWQWNGTIIAAPEGQAIRAIAKGSIVYADWLAGYGLLLIIDHHNGYMSLYGHNHRLGKKVGDSVTAGEVIASVGKSGGAEIPKLYFAIRYNGKPINPETWCRK